MHKLNMFFDPSFSWLNSVSKYFDVQISIWMGITWKQERESQEMFE